jgi:outer membrane receptor for ferrienterochelin and colicin
MKNVAFRCYLSSLSLMVLPAAAIAQNRGSSAGNELLLMDEQTVTTASKKTQKVDDVPAAVTVITEDEIRASGAVTVLDLLRYVPGVDVSEQNQTAANVSIRGLNSEYSNTLLVMIDGRSIYEDFYGGVLWQFNPLLMSRIKRIEIVRGPGSALYGANAFNGVINIITKTPAEMAATPARTVTRDFIGEHNTENLELQTTVGDPKSWTASLGLAYNHTDGFGGKQSTEARDAYTTPIITADVEKRLPRGALLLSAGNTEVTSDFYESVALNDVHFHNSFASLSYTEDRATNPITARISGNFLKQAQGGKDYGNTTTLEIELQQAHRLGRRNSLVYGANYRSIEFASDITGSPHHEEFSALYLQDEIGFSAHTSLFAGLRLDQHTLYGTQFSPRLSLVHHLPQRQSLRLSYGTAFNAPTLLDSYLKESEPLGPGLALNISGNTHLSPTRVTSYEAGYRKEFRNGFLGINGYYNQVTELINSVPTSFFPSPPAPPNTPSNDTFLNVGSATIAGFEIESELNLSKRWHLLSNYAYANVAGSNYSLAGKLTTQHKINVALRGALSSRWEAFVGAHFVGATTLIGMSGNETVPSYLRADARIAYRFSTARRPWTLALSATNLFDDRHVEYPVNQTIGPVQQVSPQRRTLYLSLTGKF